MERQINIRIEPSLIGRFFSQILSKGVRCRACVPCPLKELLCDQIGLPSEYVENRIQTVFLNGKPVDDVDTAQVAANDTIALSAAMPGLLGAVLRKGGYYSAMRQDITYERECTVAGTKDGMVVIKLFNLTVPEAGPLLLQHGIWLDASELAELLDIGTDEWQVACQEVRLDEQYVNLDQLPDLMSSGDQVFLQVNP
jgi:hypothetical protein